MNERLEEIAYDIQNNIPEILEILQQKEDLVERVVELENKNLELLKLSIKEHQNQLKYKQALEYVLTPEAYEEFEKCGLNHLKESMNNNLAEIKESSDNENPYSREEYDEAKECKHTNKDHYNHGYHAICRDCGKQIY
ncbi:hypothetical protein GLW20_07675 [Virgibacillus halodenitrificans]|nr:hypothetical protein [Virgibacillus halodenitrificans]